MMVASTPVEFRNLVIGDIPVLAGLEQEIYPQPWSTGVFYDELTHDDRVYLAAVSEGKIIGFAGLMLVGEDAHVTTLAVRSGERKAGLGTRLMLRLVTAGLERGASHLTLEVRSTNTGAQRLYEKFGMVSVGVRKHYYRDDDAVIMWVRDIDQSDYASRLAEIEAQLEERP